jgi:mannitol/fructose-specific phosphotransferase system IIA component (Ntr-type)
VKHQLISGFVPERSVFNMDASTVEEALQKLLGRYFGARSSSTRTVASVLHKISQEEPVELTRDVILLHTHLPMVEESVIFLGVNRKPLKVPLATESPHVLVILLDPVGQDPALHLKALADIARLIRIPGVVEEMRQVKSFSQFIRMIEEKLEE